MVASPAKALFHKFIDNGNNQYPEFLTCYNLEEEESLKCQLTLEYIQNILLNKQL